MKFAAVLLMVLCNAYAQDLQGPRRKLQEGKRDFETFTDRTNFTSLQLDFKPGQTSKSILGCYKVGTKYTGDVVQQAGFTLSSRGCQIKCIQNNQCVFFTHNLATKSCTLYGQDAILSPQRGFKSGNKRRCVGRCGLEQQTCCIQNSCAYGRISCVEGFCIDTNGKANQDECAVLGDKMQWHKVIIHCRGPATYEINPINPFTFYNMEVTFTQGSQQYVALGYYAANGRAAATGASSGAIWQANFMPVSTGNWKYSVSFKKGTNVTISRGGQSVNFDGFTGSFVVTESDKPDGDGRTKGLLSYVNKHYYQFQGDKSYYIKSGSDSPENFLGYADFDGTFQTKSSVPLHQYQPHLKDWKTGDPVWRQGRGKGIIGALNYLASVGVNSQYFLTMNINGDGQDVWPYVSNDPSDYDRFDVSKLEQWEIVFQHMTSLGIQLHVLTQEQENDGLLNNRNLGSERIIYYRELIARFSHHPILIWNLGEENRANANQVKSYIRYFEGNDPYKHPVAIHTFPGAHGKYRPLLGFTHFTGPSFQISPPSLVYSKTVDWRMMSAKKGRPWVIMTDEIGPPNLGAVPDFVDFQHSSIRSNTLWANLMGGGAGVEWYFGYEYALFDDLRSEDFRVRANLWRQTTLARQFFQKHVLFLENQPVTGGNKYSPAGCFTFGSSRQVVVYCKAWRRGRINLSSGQWSIRWFDPYNGDPSILVKGSKSQTSGGSVNLGQEPKKSAATKDWVCVLNKM